MAYHFHTPRYNLLYRSYCNNAQLYFWLILCISPRIPFRQFININPSSYSAFPEKPPRIGRPPWYPYANPSCNDRHSVKVKTSIFNWVLVTYLKGHLNLKLVFPMGKWGVSTNQSFQTFEMTFAERWLQLLLKGFLMLFYNLNLRVASWPCWHRSNL